MRLKQHPMLRTRIKICGITDVEAAQAAAAGGADAIGLVFVEASPRRVTIERARAILDALPATIDPIGLFADQAPAEVSAIADELHLRTVQLHGSETLDDVAALAPRRVVKALHFDEDFAEQLLAQWLPAPANLAALLWDTPPDEGAIPGGSGRTFHWEALASLLHDNDHASAPPTMLAGGLDAHNVAEAIRAVRPFAVDVSSGVEQQRGQKDPATIAAFCRAVHQADAQRGASPDSR
jgi:phosphoribosylanthranilate isomerase